MNKASTSVHKVLGLASSLRTSRHHGHATTEHTDRDLARQSHELYILTQATAPRVF